MKYVIIAILSAAMLAACGGKDNRQTEPEEDKEAKSALQGICV